ncbi:MAG: hypothetical protein J3Q66DRAFT_353847 [Benniella sp.]|nr:MAG: hypothetical protein J3Q66DRAFT_353847 [Benniella sp.]
MIPSRQQRLMDKENQHQPPPDEVLLIPLAQRKRRFEEDESTPRQEPAKRPLTVPKSPALRTPARSHKAGTCAALHGARVPLANTQNVGYKAHKVNRKIFESSGDLGVPKIPKRPLTVPKSPNFSKRPASPALSTLPLGNLPTNEADAIKHEDHHHQQQHQPLIDRAHSAPVRAPLPQPTLAQRSRSETPKSTTVPVPFKFKTDVRGERYAEQFQQNLEKWKELEKENRASTADSAPVVTGKTILKRSTKTVTHAECMHFRTEDRARQRQLVDRERRLKERLIQEMTDEKAREDELREQQEVREMRKRLTPHPAPIRHYPPLVIHRSTRPLTVPHSPNIGDKRKRQMTVEEDA